MLKPKSLFKGANVAVVSTSSFVPQERMDATIKSIKDMGLNPVMYSSCYKRHAHFSGTDQERADDLNSAFADKNIDGILAIRGGYGANRLMNLLDFDMIKQNPKYFAGYSDITALHIALNQKCGFSTYHTPMPSTEWYKGMDSYTTDKLIKMMFGDYTGEIENPNNIEFKTLNQGCATGVLTGGNLSLCVSSIGTHYEIDTKDKIVFLEDIGEKPYRIDSMLLQMKNAGKFKDCAGIILGAWTDCEDVHPEDTITKDEVFHDMLVSENKPLLSNFVCGHCMPTASLPLGSTVKLDATNKKIIVVK